MLQTRFGVSERRACRVVGQHRSTQRLEPPAPTDDDAELREWLRAFSVERPRWGWRRAAKALRREDRKINYKRVQRLWREKGLRVPYKKRRKRMVGTGCRFNDVDTIFIDSLLQAQVLIEDWRVDDNINRPHSAHCELTPGEFTQAWTTRRQPALV